MFLPKLNFTFFIHPLHRPTGGAPGVKVCLEGRPRGVDEERDEEDEGEHGEDGEEDEEGRRVEKEQIHDRPPKLALTE